MRRILLGCVLAISMGCGREATTEEPTPEPQTTGDQTADGTNAEPAPSGTTLTPDDCTARGGTLVGDIGDGAIHQPGYLCPNGQPPIGSVPLGIEGSVCCGQ